MIILLVFKLQATVKHLVKKNHLDEMMRKKHEIALVRQKISIKRDAIGVAIFFAQETRG